MRRARFRLYEACCRPFRAESSEGAAFPFFPWPDSIAGKLLAEMLCGDHVSAESLWERYGVSVRVNDIKMLRRRGWPVQRSDVLFNDPQDGATIHLSLYFLSPFAILAAGRWRQQFLDEVRQASHTVPTKEGWQ